MRIAFLLAHAGVEKGSVFIEVIKYLMKRNVDIDIIIANQRRGYEVDKFYSDNEHVKICFLNMCEENRGRIESLKEIIRRLNLEKACTTLILMWQKLLFHARKNKYHDEKSYAYDLFLSSHMQQYRLQGKYDYIWVVDEYGLIWANWLNEHSTEPCKLVYHCYELYWEHYLKQHNRQWRCFLEYLLFEEAQKVLQKTDLIIIQDKLRWNVLCDYADLAVDTKKFFLPLSMKSYDYINTDKLRKQLNCEQSKKIIFYPTLIAEKRGCIELAEISQMLPEDYVTVIHGFAALPGVIRKIYNVVRDSGKVIVSNTAFHYDELVAMHQEVWCVFLYYGETDNNDKYIVNSSNKLTMALQAGKPIITIGNRMMKELCDMTECGIALEGWSGEEFVHAISELERNYDQYCKNARKCFEDRYDIELYGSSLYNILMQATLEK